MKILFVNNYYPRFLQHFSSKNKEKIASTDYESHKKLLFGELFSVSNYYSQAVIAQGYEAADIVANDWILQNKWSHEHGLHFQTFPPIFLESRIGQHLFLTPWMERILGEQIHEFKPDILYFFNIENFSLDFLRHQKKAKRMIVSQKASPISSMDKYNIADVVFSALPSLVKLFSTHHIRSRYMPFAFEPTVLRKIPKQKKKYACTFVGGFSNIHSTRNSVLTDAAERGHIDIFGYGKDILPHTSKAYKNHHGEVWGKDMYKVLMQSNMTINSHVDMAGEYAANIRLFEATGCGAMLLTDKKKNLGDLFIDGKEVVSYTDADDLCDKIRYYAKHPKQRDAIAKAGQKRTLKDHTYDIRMKEVLGILTSKL